MLYRKKYLKLSTVRIFSLVQFTHSPGTVQCTLMMAGGWGTEKRDGPSQTLVSVFICARRNLPSLTNSRRFCVVPNT